MSTIAKLIALVLVVVLLAPMLGGQSEFGRVVNAVVEDASAFCERRPEACHQTAEIARQTGRVIANAVATLTAGGDAGTLTAQDRALAPASEEPETFGRISPFAYGSHAPAAEAPDRP